MSDVLSTILARFHPELPGGTMFGLYSCSTSVSIIVKSTFGTNGDILAFLPYEKIGCVSSHSKSSSS